MRDWRPYWAIFRSARRLNERAPAEASAERRAFAKSATQCRRREFQLSGERRNNGWPRTLKENANEEVSDCVSPNCQPHGARYGGRNLLDHVRQQHEGTARRLQSHDKQAVRCEIQVDGRIQITGGSRCRHEDDERMWLIFTVQRETSPVISTGHFFEPGFLEGSLNTLRPLRGTAP